MQEAIDEAVAAEIATIIGQGSSLDLELVRLKGPSSTWTYLINDNPFGWMVGLAKGKNIGFVSMAFSAPLFTGALLILILILSRLSRRKRK